MTAPTLVGVTTGDNVAAVSQHANTQVGDHILLFWGAPNNPSTPTFTPNSGGGGPTLTREGVYDMGVSTTTNDGFVVIDRGIATQAGTALIGTLSNGDPFAGYWICIVTRGTRHALVAPQVLGGAPGTNFGTSVSGINYTVPDITPGVNDALLVSLAATFQDSAATSGRLHTPPTGYTERGKIGMTAGESNNLLMAASTKQLTGQRGIAQGATTGGNLRATNGSAPTYRNPASLVVALLPANSAPSAPTWGANPVVGTLYDATVPYVVNAATDADGDPIVYDIERSTDGSTWTSVLADTTTLSGNLTSTAWPASATTRLRVRAKDDQGGVSAWVSSPIFNVQHTSHVKYWNGSAWVVKPLKYWNGSAWTNTRLKRWNGSAWVSLT